LRRDERFGEASNSDFQLEPTATACSRSGTRRKLSSERREYEEVWRKLLNDADAAGALGPAVDSGSARLAILGALN